MHHRKGRRLLRSCCSAKAACCSDLAAVVVMAGAFCVRASSQILAGSTIRHWRAFLPN
ncbi:hypothetical protein RISK_000700 [Rhodopirellula islandica]|uniref:Signal peptide and transmembrane protein n=1 Tax=Rhodopirellula islandica TaxID=595434 RepID=A0A0J1EN45_RHOIS|nr:hypothetical protein RISK_000700 [Rhodopirellula islandica]